MARTTFSGPVRSLNGFEGDVVIPEPTPTERGGVLQQAAIADVAAAPTDVEYNALLAALRAAGILAV